MLRDVSFMEKSTLPGLLRFWADRHPERLAFREKDLGIWNRFTFRDYYETEYTTLLETRNEKDSN